MRKKKYIYSRYFCEGNNWQLCFVWFVLNVKILWVYLAKRAKWVSLVLFHNRFVQLVYLHLLSFILSNYNIYLWHWATIRTLSKQEKAFLVHLSHQRSKDANILAPNLAKQAPPMLFFVHDFWKFLLFFFKLIWDY